MSSSLTTDQVWTSAQLNSSISTSSGDSAQKKMPPGLRGAAIYVAGRRAGAGSTECDEALGNIDGPGLGGSGIGTHVGNDRFQLFIARVLEKSFHPFLQGGLLVAPFVSGRLAHASSSRRTAAVVFLFMTSSFAKDVRVT
jgi:hypothetical protein